MHRCSMRGMGQRNSSDRTIARENVHRFQRTPDFVKARAMQLYAEYGLEEASRRMGVDKTTINRWRKELGIPSKKLMPVSVEDIDKALREQQMLRLDVQNLLINKSRLVLLQITEDKKGEELYNLARTAATLLDKYRLEQGEATNRKETSLVDESFSEKERMLLMRNLSAELAERARRQAARVTDGTSDGVLEGTATESLPRLSSGSG